MFISIFLGSDSFSGIFKKTADTWLSKVTVLALKGRIEMGTMHLTNDGSCAEQEWVRFGLVVASDYFVTARRSPHLHKFVLPLLQYVITHR